LIYKTHMNLLKMIDLGQGSFVILIEGTFRRQAVSLIGCDRTSSVRGKPVYHVSGAFVNNNHSAQIIHTELAFCLVNRLTCIAVHVYPRLLYKPSDLWSRIDYDHLQSETA